MRVDTGVGLLLEMRSSFKGKLSMPEVADGDVTPKCTAGKPTNTMRIYKGTSSASRKKKKRFQWSESNLGTLRFEADV